MCTANFKKCQYNFKDHIAGICSSQKSIYQLYSASTQVLTVHSRDRVKSPGQLITVISSPQYWFISDRWKLPYFTQTKTQILKEFNTETSRTLQDQNSFWRLPVAGKIECEIWGLFSDCLGTLLRSMSWLGSALAVVGSFLHEAPTLDWWRRGRRNKMHIMLEVIDRSRLGLSRPDAHSATFLTTQWWPIDGKNATNLVRPVYVGCLQHCKNNNKYNISFKSYSAIIA